MKVKVLVLMAAVAFSTVANAGWFGAEKQKACFESLSRSQRTYYTCEFGKVVRIRERGGDSDRGNRGGNRGGCKGDRGGRSGGRN